MTHKVYRGPAGQGARPVTVTVCEGEGEHSWAVSSAPLEHHVHHSPDGFAWGYAGSGAAELARCLLWDHLGAEPDPAAYQALKDRLIVPVHAEFGFSCTTADLDQFCAGYRGPLTVSVHGFDCGDIWCRSCAAERSARSTARRTAARKGAATRGRR